MDKRKKYVRLLATLIVILSAILVILTFSNHRYLPNWSKIIGAFSKSDKSVSQEDFVRFINVGQGDSILISSNGYNALVDFGNSSDYGSDLLDCLEGYGIKELDCIFVSHYDSDHVGGGAMVLDAMKVHYAVLPEQNDREENDFDDFQYALENNKTQVHIAQVGSLINIGDFDITILGYYRGEQDSNDRSIILMAEIFGKKFLLTGDAGQVVEKQLLKDGINVDCNVFKAAHHGSRGSSSKEFVSAASPDYAVISCGASNQYGHPHDETLKILADCGAKIYRTDRSGDITFKVTDGKIKVNTEY